MKGIGMDTNEWPLVQGVSRLHTHAHTLWIKLFFCSTHIAWFFVFLFGLVLFSKE